MTRCYEFYCMFKTTPQRCELKDRATLWRIDSYMKRFEDKGIKFDYGEEDKELFYKLHDEIGSEHKVGRVGDHQPLKKPESTQKPHDFGKPKLTRCGFPDCQKGAYYPIFYEDVPVCPDCDKKIQEDPSLVERLKEKPSQPQRTEKKTYDKIKPTWEERQATMHPKVSKMEFEVITELQAEGWPVDTEYWIPLTKPDGYLHEIRLPLEVDGEQVHKGKKAERDELVNEILRRRDMEPARERFSSYSVKRKEEIKASFRERMIQGYCEKGLELPSAVKES